MSCTIRAIAMVAGLTLLAPLALAQPATDRGQAILEANCARCHATGKSGASPLDKAPPFRQLGRRYPIEQLAESLAEGIVTGHAEMPQFAFDPPDINAIITYLKAIAE